MRVNNVSIYIELMCLVEEYMRAGEYLTAYRVHKYAQKYKQAKQ